MADILIKVGNAGPNPAYRDGDVIGIYTDEQILLKNAEIVCGVNRFGTRVVNVHLVAGSLENIWYEETHQYKHVRVSAIEVEKFDLWNLTSEIRVVPTLQANINRYLRNPNHSIFGSPGSEFWYRTPIDFDRVGTLWDAIEAASANLRADNGRMPFGIGDFKVHLMGTMPNIDGDLVSTITTVESLAENVLRKRNFTVPWEDGKFGLTNKQKNDAKNSRKETDERDFFQIVATDMQPKAALPQT